MVAITLQKNVKSVDVVGVMIPANLNDPRKPLTQPLSHGPRLDSPGGAFIIRVPLALAPLGKERNQCQTTR